MKGFGSLAPRTIVNHVAVVVKTVLGSHFGVGAARMLVYFSGEWDVHWGYGLLTHDHVCSIRLEDLKGWPSRPGGLPTKSSCGRTRDVRYGPNSWQTLVSWEGSGRTCLRQRASSSLQASIKGRGGLRARLDRQVNRPFDSLWFASPSLLFHIFGGNPKDTTVLFCWVRTGQLRRRPASQTPENQTNIGKIVVLARVAWSDVSLYRPCS